MFHANLITPYKETELHRPNFTRLPPDLIEGEKEFEVKKILDAQPRGQGRKMHFLVKWKGYPTSNNSWEPRENLHADRLIMEYNKKKQRQAEPKRKGVKSRRARTEEIIPPSSQTTIPLFKIILCLFVLPPFLLRLWKPPVRLRQYLPLTIPLPAVPPPLKEVPQSSPTKSWSYWKK